MALLTCPDCSNEVSDQAAACPHCGRPFHLPAGIVPAGAHPEVVSALLRGGKIEAIKLQRMHNPGFDLAAAKAEVERIEQALPPGSITKQRGCTVRAVSVLLVVLVGIAAWSCR